MDHDEAEMVREAALRQGHGLAQFVREAALMRARMATDDHPFPLREILAELKRSLADTQRLMDIAQSVVAGEVTHHPH